MGVADEPHPLSEREICMDIFYRGASRGTYWNIDRLEPGDSRGLTAQSPRLKPDPDRIMDHIIHGAERASPFISLTKSYGVASDYARYWYRTRPPTEDNPGLVYHIEISYVREALILIDPVKALAESLPDPLDSGCQHDGVPEFLLGVVSPERFGFRLTRNRFDPPGSQRTPGPPYLSRELETLARALRDAEILATGVISGTNITRVDAVWGEHDGYALFC